MLLASLLTTEGKIWHYFLLFQTYLMQRHLVYKKHSSHAYFVQRMAEHTKYCHKHLLLWGKKSGWRFRERFIFQTCCMTDGSPAFVTLFTHTFHQGKMLPLRTRLFLLPAFFVVVFIRCASLWGSHPAPRHGIMMAKKSDTFITRQSIKYTAFLSELLKGKQGRL